MSQGTELAIRDEQIGFDQKQVAALHQMGAHGASPADLAVFFHQCKRTGLDPFARQIYLVPRYSSKAGQTTSTIQVGIDGFRVIADRAGGKRAMPFVAWCGADGVWVEAWLKPEPPAACKVIVTRDGAEFPAVATYAEYAQTNRNGQPNSMWAKMPATMLAKCAEALALRKAYPMDLSGLYTDDETGQAENLMPAQVQAPAQVQEVTQPTTPRAPVAEPLDETKLEVFQLQVATLALTPAQVGKTIQYVMKRPVTGPENLNNAELQQVIEYLYTRMSDTQRDQVLQVIDEQRQELELGIVDAEIIEDGGLA